MTLKISTGTGNVAGCSTSFL